MKFQVEKTSWNWSMTVATVHSNRARNGSNCIHSTAHRHFSTYYNNNSSSFNNKLKIRIAHINKLMISSSINFNSRAAYTQIEWIEIDFLKRECLNWIELNEHMKNGIFPRQWVVHWELAKWSQWYTRDNRWDSRAQQQFNQVVFFFVSFFLNGMEFK